MPGIQPDRLKVEMRQVVGGNRLDKPSFGERFAMGFKKFIGFFGRLGSQIAPLFGPLGGLIGAGLYGVSNLAERSIEKQMAKKMSDLGVSEQIAMNPQNNFITPGMMDTGYTQGQGGSINNFSTDGLEMQRFNAFNLRGLAGAQSINQMATTL